MGISPFDDRGETLMLNATFRIPMAGTCGTAEVSGTSPSGAHTSEQPRSVEASALMIAIPPGASSGLPVTASGIVTSQALNATGAASGTRRILSFPRV